MNGKFDNVTVYSKTHDILLRCLLFYKQKVQSIYANGSTIKKK